MIAHDTNEVKNRGDELSEVLWRGRQWAVTKYGIEALDGSYPIAAERLDEDFAEWSWIRQICEKTWVDRPDFTTAFMVAIVLHGRAPDFDPATILKHFRSSERAMTEPNELLDSFGSKKIRADPLASGYRLHHLLSCRFGSRLRRTPHGAVFISSLLNI